MLKLKLTIYICLFSSTLARPDWRKASLKLHNKYRKCHDADDLKPTDELNSSAQRCAEYLASEKQMAHVCNGVFGTQYGENLASGSALSQDASTAGVQSTQAWYSERPNHKYDEDFQNTSGHFSQVVWKNTKQFGMGYARNGDFVIVVAHYNPPGNFMGQFSQNVFPPMQNCV